MWSPCGTRVCYISGCILVVFCQEHIKNTSNMIRRIRQLEHIESTKRIHREHINTNVIHREHKKSNTPPETFRRIIPRDGSGGGSSRSPVVRGFSHRMEKPMDYWVLTLLIKFVTILNNLSPKGELITVSMLLSG